MNDLVVTGQEVQMPTPNGVSTVGGSILDSGNRLLEDVRQGEWENLTTYADGAFFALDAIGLAADPIGGVIKAGVGWLFQHVAFLREPIEFLTGDPNFVRALSDTWSNIGDALTQAADGYADLLRNIQDWHGRAADAYRSLAGNYAFGLHGLSGYAANLSAGMTVAATAVATTRMVVFETIVTWITAVTKRALVAAVSAFFTGGGSLAVFISSTVADAAILLGRLTGKIRKLLQVLRRFRDRFGTMGRKADELDVALRHTQRNLGRFAGRQLGSARRPDILADQLKLARSGNRLQDLQRVKDLIDRSGYRFPKEAAKQIAREIDRHLQM